MQDKVILPQWLDHLIFNELGAKYCRSNSNMTVINWDKSDVLNYLGTYFPRSYAEAYCIFSTLFKMRKDLFASKSELSLFDFGCGTGGEIIGLMDAINDNLPDISVVKVDAFDGNHHALRLYEEVFSKTEQHIKFKAKTKVIPFEIEDFYDLSALLKVIHGEYDIVMTFKAICEFVTKDRFEKQNPYSHIVNSFLPKLKTHGLFVLDDVTSYNNVSQQWLPHMIDVGLLNVQNYQTIERNYGFNQTFLVNHSYRSDDISKVAWRIIQKQ